MIVVGFTGSAMEAWRERAERPMRWRSSPGLEESGRREGGWSIKEY
jgi:hypothetical protein